MDVSAKAVRFDDRLMWVELSDGRTIGVPYTWFPRPLKATPPQREAVEIGGLGLHWAEIDEDISIAGLLAGRSDRTADGSQGATARAERVGKKTNVYIEGRPKDRPAGAQAVDYAVEDRADHLLKVCKTRAEAIAWAKSNGYAPLVARVRYIRQQKNPDASDKQRPDHWRAA